MKRLIAIAVIGFSLLGSMAQALADCLDATAGAHGGPGEATIASPGDLSYAGAAGSTKIHCADVQWRVGFFLRSSGEHASRQLGRVFPLAGLGVPHTGYPGDATLPKSFLTSPPLRAPIYIDASVLRI